MARSCSICTRTDAGKINDLLVGGRSARSVAAELDLSHRALLRHATNHLSRQAASDDAVAPPAGLDPLDELTASLRVKALAGDVSSAREYRLALSARQTALRAAAPVRDLASEPEWAELRARLLRLLAPFPEARQAVADELGLE